jgi:hypothetical protein
MKIRNMTNFEKKTVHQQQIAKNELSLEIGITTKDYPWVPNFPTIRSAACQKHRSRYPTDGDNRLSLEGEARGTICPLI